MAVLARRRLLCCACICSVLLGKVWLFCGPRARPTSSRIPRNAAKTVVSFDLDDTLWPVVQVIEEANQRLAKAHHQLAAEEVVGTMRRLRQEPTWENVSYSELRCSAYAELLGDKSIAADALQQWICARNDAAAIHLYPDVLPCLEGLSSSGAMVGAITNGMGNPTEIPILSEFFHFCVSAEEESIFPHRKPSPVIFEEALARARNLGWNERAQWWHVGDDLATDVAAAARLGLRTVHVDRPDRVENRFSVTSAEKLAERRAGADLEPDLTVSSLNGLADKILTKNSNKKLRQRPVS